MKKLIVRWLRSALKDLLIEILQELEVEKRTYLLNDITDQDEKEDPDWKILEKEL